MIVVESDRTAFFDVDETLIFWTHQDADLPTVIINDREFQIHTKHIEKIRNYHIMGWVTFVWSGSGHAWAKTVVEALGLTTEVKYVMCKPHRIFDDQKDISTTLIHGFIPIKE